FGLLLIVGPEGEGLMINQQRAWTVLHVEGGYTVHRHDVSHNLTLSWVASEGLGDRVRRCCWIANEVIGLTTGHPGRSALPIWRNGRVRVEYVPLGLAMVVAAESGAVVPGGAATSRSS